MPNEPLPRDKNLRPRAAELRKRATGEERHLWYDYLRTHPIQFYRQRIIGGYIVDFYCDRARLVIELDGPRHDGEAAREYDAVRTAYLESLGIAEMRFSNARVRDQFEAVCMAIDAETRRRLEEPASR